MKKDEIKMESICCLQCATTVEKEVARLNGIKDAIADYGTKTLLVEYSEAVIDRAAIESRVKEVLRRFESEI